MCMHACASFPPAHTLLTTLSADYDTVYTCPMGRLQLSGWCMYLVVCDSVLDIIIQLSTKTNKNAI